MKNDELKTLKKEREKLERKLFLVKEKLEKASAKADSKFDVLKVKKSKVEVLSKEKQLFEDEIAHIDNSIAEIEERRAKENKKNNYIIIGCCAFIVVLIGICVVFAINEEKAFPKEGITAKQQNETTQQVYTPSITTVTTAETSPSTTEAIQDETEAPSETEAAVQTNTTQKQAVATTAANNSLTTQAVDVNNSSQTTVESVKQEAHNYVLNTNTLIIHTPDCWQVRRIHPENRRDVSGFLQDYLNQGYERCSFCHPE